ncbi:hypothetical protein HZB60_12180 [candidate division KSB1 bacterium]|nr:hypothetical protein [candidate division KSB1 bacterium]
MPQLLIALLLSLSSVFAQSAVVTQCEWFTGVDPGLGNGTAIALGTPEAQESLAFSVATGSFTAGQLTRVKIRCKADSVRGPDSLTAGRTNIWGIATDGLLLLSPASGVARLVTSMSYQVDNGSFTNVDVADAGIANFADIVSTVGLTDGLHRVRIRATDDLSRTGVVTDGYLVVSNTAAFATRLVTQLEYRFDSGAFTPVDVVDGAIVNLNEIIATAGLTNGLHRLQVRSTDDLGRVGPVHDGYLVISNTAGSGPRLVTQMEYRIDGGAFVPVDNADAGIVNFNELFATNALAIGLHNFDLRSLDDLGRIGPVHRAYLIVSSPFAGGGERYLTAAEYFINVDPGPGNGVPIPLPGDGTWDEGIEDEAVLLTGLPVGLHLFGLRTRDDLGRWSVAGTDSIIVGPVLTIRPVAGNIVLDWRVDPGATQYKIYRAPTFGGSYALIDSTTAQTYTDATIVPSPAQRYYHVTFEAGAFSTYRLPAATPVLE